MHRRGVTQSVIKIQLLCIFRHLSACARNQIRPWGRPWRRQLEHSQPRSVIRHFASLSSCFIRECSRHLPRTGAGTRGFNSSTLTTDLKHGIHVIIQSRHFYVLNLSLRTWILKYIKQYYCQFCYMVMKYELSNKEKNRSTQLEHGRKYGDTHLWRFGMDRLILTV